MSTMNQAAAELEKWIQQQLNKGISQEKLYFLLLKKGFGRDVISTLLNGYEPTLKKAIIEHCPNRELLPEPKWFLSQSHFFSFAHIKLTNNQNSAKVATEKAQMYVLPSVIPEKLCQQLIIRSKRYFAPSEVVGESNSQTNAGRTSSTALVRDIAPDAERKFQSIIGELMGIDPKYCEPLQIQRYETGQEYQVHADWFDVNHAGYQENIKVQGQRTWTCLIYLNNDFEGGETHFPDLKLRIKPATGKGCVWNNLHLTGEVNKDTYHCGTPVTKGNKYILTAWFRARPSQ